MWGEEMDWRDGVSSTHRAAWSDTAQSTQDTMQEEMRAIEALPFVTKLSFVRAVRDKVAEVDFL